MATKIRLARIGKIRSPHYRVVVIDSRSSRNGRAIEEVGLYHPMKEPSLIQIDSERVQYWLGVGAQPTEAVIALLKRTGDWQKFTGEKAPEGVDPQPEPVDKLARFNAALAEADGDVTTEAITKKKTADASAEAEDADEKPAADETDEPAADKAAEAEEADA